MAKSFSFDDEIEERKDYILDKFESMLGGDIGNLSEFKKEISKIKKKSNKDIDEKNMLYYYNGLIDKEKLISEYLGDKGKLKKYYDREFKTIDSGFLRANKKSFASVKGKKVLVTVEKRLINGEFRLMLRDSKGHFAKAI